MFVKSVLKDSFKELKLVLKDYKLMIVTLIALLINSYFKNSIILRESTGALIIMAILGLFFGVYQYSALGELISSKDKKIMEGVSKGYWSRFFRLLGTSLLLILIFIGLVIVLTITLTIVTYILAMIISKGDLVRLYFDREFLLSGLLKIYYVPMIILLFLLARILISIPLSILDDTDKPINLSLEISKGYIFGVFFVNICFSGFMLYTLVLIEKILNFNMIINLIILIPLNFLFSTLIALFLINSTYYLLNKDKLLKQNKEKSFEEVYNNQ
ncbi:MAG: hypothetical protein JXM74_02715 [Fusobacteriaceae bacterium]|nr:hypothetical protein [Fusobacteriaceae bacterium]MBN2837643.1 hypothetical protein [Fusobacteriaceae bacterium]